MGIVSSTMGKSKSTRGNMSGTWGIMLISYVLAISTVGMVMSTCEIMPGTQGK